MHLQNKEDSSSPDQLLPGPPTLIQSTLDFGCMLLGSQKTLQQVIVNSTKKPMIWLTDASEARWLILNPDHGILQPGEQQSIRVTADTASLEAGEHSITLTFSSEGDETSMSEDTISKVTVEAPPQPPALQAGLDLGWLTPHSTSKLGLLITNPDDRPVEWCIQIGTGKTGMGVRETLEHSERPPGITENFSITKVNGVILEESAGKLEPGESRTISVTANAAKLKGGYAYTTNLTLITQVPGSASASMQVPVTFYVNQNPDNDGGPRVPTDLPLHISFPIQRGQKSGTHTLTFTNDNPEVVGWDLRSDAPWLIPSPLSGQFKANEKASVVLTAQRAGLTAGSHTAHLYLTLNWVPATDHHMVATRPVFLSVQ